MSDLERLLNKVNKVTAPWRHGKRVDPKAMDELVARQIEIEESSRVLPVNCEHCDDTGWISDFHDDGLGSPSYLYCHDCPRGLEMEASDVPYTPPKKKKPVFGVLYRQVSSVGNFICSGCGYSAVLAPVGSSLSLVKFCTHCGKPVKFEPKKGVQS